MRTSKDELLHHSQPEIRSGFERIGNALALIHEDIPMVPSLQKWIYGKEFPKNETPRIDYVDLATDEIVERAERFKSSLQEPSLANLKYRARIFMQKVVNPRVLELDSEMVSKDRQDSDFTVYSSRLGYIDEKRKLRKILQESPSKKLLVIFGHGDSLARLDGDKPELFWSIGEMYTLKGHYTDLNQVLLRMLQTDGRDVNSEKYAAILIDSCNETGLKPLKLEGMETPIFYVEGTAAIISVEGTSYKQI